MIISAKKTAVFTVMVLLFSVFAGKSAVFAALADETSGGDNDVSSVRDAAVWGLNASVENEEIILKWEPSGKMDMVYDIYRSTQPDGEYLKINKEPIRENLYSDNPENSIIEPVGGVVYYYRVEGVLEGASAGESEIVSAEKPEGRLVPPSDFEAQAVFMNVNLNWSAPRSTGENSVEGYHIYRSETQGEAGERINSEIIKGYEYRDASGQEGTEYFYSIQSEDAEGNVSEISRQVSAVPFEKTSVPADIQMEQLSNESIYLTWAEPEGGTFGISGYNIYRTTKPGRYDDEPLNIRPVQPLENKDGRHFYYDNMVFSRQEPGPGIDYYYKIVPIDSRGATTGASAEKSFFIEPEVIPQKGILSHDISQYGLPPDSKISISGQKIIAGSWLVVDPDARTSETKNLDIDQPFRIKLNGHIGSNIKIDVDYDDSREQFSDDGATKISIQYSGEQQDTVQEASFGDITLSLPPTKYVSFTQKLFGLMMKAKLVENLNFTGFAAKSKGISATQSFIGSKRQKEVDGDPFYTINDTDYFDGTYFYLTKDPSQVSELTRYGDEKPEEPVTIVPESVIVYLDDGIRQSSLVNPNAVYSSNDTFQFDRKYLGTDYTVDYRTGVVKFVDSIPKNYTIAVAYKTSDGQSIGYNTAGTDMSLDESRLVSASDGYTSDSAHLIQDGRVVANGETDISHKNVNTYFLGETQIENPAADENFMIRIKEKGSDEVAADVPPPTEPEASDWYEIDTNLGLLKFKAFYPFAKDAAVPGDPTNNSVDPEAEDAYNTTKPISNYYIELQYSYNVSSYRLDNFPVVFGTERVVVDGRLLKKDVDYYIFYETGEITFTDRVSIEQETQIDISYEYTPFFQTFNSNVYGGRLDYEMFENLKLGGTLLFKDAAAGRDVPDAKSTDNRLTTPMRMFVADADIKFSLDKKQFNDSLGALPFLDKTNLPLDFSFSGEIAHSDLNMNTYENSATDEMGVAMIDSMEGADNVIRASMEETNWFPASVPLGLEAENRNYITKEKITETGHEVRDPEDPLANSQQVMMRLDFNGLEQGEWDSYRYVISRFGENLNRYNTLEIWMYVETSAPIKIDVDVGIISEDSNSNNTLEFEGPEDDRRFRTQYDTGISSGIYPHDPEYWGEDNGIYDSEDMNGNGALDTTEAFYRFSADGTRYYHPELSSADDGKWINVKIPLSEFSSYFGLDARQIDPNNRKFFASIQHLRITVKGAGAAPAGGHIKLESVQFTGNSWSLETLSNSYDLAGNHIDAPDPDKMRVSTISRSTDESYEPNLDYFSYMTDDEKDSEEALKIEYALSLLDNRTSDGKPIYYATKLLSNTLGYDYQPYQKLKFDIYYDKRDSSAGPGRIMFIRLGSGPDEETLYYQYNLQLDSIPAEKGWHTVEFMLDGSDGRRSEPVGAVNLRKIQYITIGFINPNSTVSEETLYINNIRITEPEPRVGSAKFAESIVNIENIGRVVHTYEEKDSGFMTMLDLNRSAFRRHEKINRTRFEYKQFVFLPVTLDYTRSEYYTEDDYRDDRSFTGDFSWPDAASERIQGYARFTAVPGMDISSNVVYDSTDREYFEQYSYQDGVQTTLRVSPNIRYTTSPNIKIGEGSDIPLGDHTFESSFIFENIKSDYDEFEEGDSAAGMTYYDKELNNRQQTHSWTGSFKFGSVSVSPYYGLKLYDSKGSLPSRYLYYSDAISTDRNKTDRYLVTKREINPKLTVNTGELWVFNPVITYNVTNSTDYTLSRIVTTGDLSMNTGIKLSRLSPLLPDITNFSLSVKDNNRRYENSRVDGAMTEFENLTPEEQWYANIFSYLFDEEVWLWPWDEGMKQDLNYRRHEIEKISFGTLSKSMSLSMGEYRLFDRLGFSPSLSISMRRENQPNNVIMYLGDTVTFNLNRLTFYNVTLPLPWNLVNKADITGNFSFSRDTRYRSDVSRDAPEEERIYSRNETKSGEITLPYNADGGVDGQLYLGANHRLSILDRNETTTLTLNPRLTINYKWSIREPVTVPGWIPFIGNKTFRFENSLNINTVLSLKRLWVDDGREDTKAGDKSEHNFNADTNVSYNMLQNVKVSFGLGYGWQHDYNNPDDVRDSFHQLKIMARGVIDF